MKSFLPQNSFTGTAKRFAVSTVAGIAIPCSMASAGAATIWSTNFDNPPYELNKTVVGKQGWTVSLFDSTTTPEPGVDPELDAALVSYTGASGGTALRLYSTSTNTATLRQRSRINNSFEKVTGSQVELNFSIAYDWTGNSVNGTSISFSLADNSPVRVYFSAANGIYLDGTYGTEENKTILSTAQMTKNEFYNFTILLDFEARTFDLSVTGGGSSVTPLTGVSFRNGTLVGMDGVSAVRLINDRGDNISMYVDQISVTAIPEGRTLGMMGGAGAMLVIGSVLRKRKVKQMK